ncbi:MAG: DUF1990 domain-containing protein [Leifsonia sp.]
MTSPELSVWPPTDPAYRRSEISALVGTGDDTWDRASSDILLWAVKTASGFTVDAEGPVVASERVTVTIRVAGIAITEPVQVVDVVTEPDRVGFSYRTLPGHPVSGEEAFIVQRNGDEVHLVIRSLTRRAPQQPWRMLFPLLLVAQRVARQRYLRSLR